MKLERKCPPQSTKVSAVNVRMNFKKQIFKSLGVVVKKETSTGLTMGLGILASLCGPDRGSVCNCSKVGGLLQRLEGRRQS